MEHAGINNLINKSKSFALSQEDIDRSEAGRLSFISKFPLNQIRNLTIDEYVLGTDENSFCFWLEFKKILFGIGGGNASKFGLYKSKEGKYFTNSGKNKKELTGKELSDHFQLVKDGIIKALQCVQEDKIEDIINLDVPIWNMVLQKILAIYYPEKFIMMGAPDVIIECANDVDIGNFELVPENSIQLNYESRKKLSADNFFKDWHYAKLSSLVWQSYFDDSKRSYYILGSKYGENANIDVFPKMLQRSVISTGFASSLDLSEYFGKNQSEIVEYLKEQGEDSNSYSALKYFLTLKEGDRIAVKASGSPKGGEAFLSIVGIAEVIEKDGKIYEHDPDGLGQTINVKYLNAPVYKEFNLGYGKTIHKLSNQEHIDLIFKSDYGNQSIDKFKEWLTSVYKQSQGINLTEKSIYSYVTGIKYIDRDLVSKKIIPVNSLFEINSVEELSSINNAYFSTPEIRDWNLKGNNMYSNSFQRYIEYMEYEFKQKSLTPNKEIKMELNTILFGPPGTGKTFRLQNEYFEKFTTKTSSLTKEQYFINKIVNYSWWQVIGAVLLDLKKAKVSEIQAHELIRYKTAVSETTTVKPTLWGSLQAHTIEECSLVKVSRKISPLIFNKLEDSIWEFVGDVKEEVPEIEELLNEYKNFSPATGKEIKRYKFLTFHQSYSYEDFIEGIKPVLSENGELQDLNYTIEPGIFKEMCDIANQDPNNDYAIFIDEINRGNISNIFGELITLIEDDKRIGAKNPIYATLPYSKKSFGVPKNLYIIGTMNTADRSVEALDTALRRRFSFVEMMPDYTVLKVTEDGVNLAELLETINKRLRYLINEDHQIGHSYFIGITGAIELKAVFKNKLIPLLKEYFYSDASKIQLVLGEGFVKKETAKKPKFAIANNDVLDKDIYTIVEIDSEFNMNNAISKLMG
jgi:hypothetical protein